LESNQILGSIFVHKKYEQSCFGGFAWQKESPSVPLGFLKQQKSLKGTVRRECPAPCGSIENKAEVSNFEAEFMNVQFR
jgi:hypothetical protein